MKIGIQLYTVREDLTTDFSGTLEALAKMGYKAVEFAWIYGGLSPEKLAALLNDLGMGCCGMHLPLEQLLNPSAECYEYAEAIDSPFVTTSLAGEVAKDWDTAIRNVGKSGEIAAAQGRVFSYHHHAQEFARINGEYALDLLLRKTEPAFVKLQPDTHWIYKGGEDPAHYIRQYAGRAPQLHIKDVDPLDGSTAEVGMGVLDVPGILAAAKESGVRWVIVEQDISKKTPLESARMSADRLHAEGLV